MELFRVILQLIKTHFSLKWIKVESSLLQAATCKVNLFVDCHDEGPLLSLDLILPLFLFHTPQFFIASGSGFWFVLQPKACVCIRQVPRNLCLRYQTCKVERSQIAKLDAKVSSTKLDASENCFNLQISYMKGEPPGTNQQVIPGRKACLGILPITDFALLWVARKHRHHFC